MSHERTVSPSILLFALFAIICACTGLAQENAATPGLVAHWSFDRIEDGAVADASGHGHTGQVRGGASSAAGISGQALRFNGSDAHVEVAMTPALQAPNGFSVAAWVYPSGAHQGGYGGIVNSLNGAANSRLLVRSDGTLLAQLHGSTTGVSASTLLGDLWNHAVYTYDGREEVWYLNGRRSASSAYSGPMPVGDRPLTIGWGYTETEYYHLNGLIDELGIYNRPLSEADVGALYARHSSKIEAELARRAAEQRRQIEAMDLIDHGVPARLATRRGVVATCDAQNRPLLLICTMDNYERALRSSLLVVDVLEGTTEQYWYPDKSRPIGEVYSVLLASTGKFYTMFGRQFLEFDPTARTWTFSRPGPGLAMSFTEAPDGTIYAATYPGSNLIAFKPDTQQFTDYGKLDETEMYPRSLAVDDAGWVYCGIGVAKANLVAFNPTTRELRQIPAAGERPPGSGSVFRAVNGKAYGYVGGSQCYELFNGDATPVPKPAADRAPVRSGSQGTFIREFPDGHRVGELNLTERWLDVVKPGGKGLKRIQLAYESEGPGILSIIAGPDGRIYGSTGLPLHFFAYDPEQDHLQDWGGVKHGAHFNAMAVQGHRIVGAAYCGGHLLSYDMTKPWTNERGSHPNPTYLGNWARDLTRPAALLAHPDGEHVIMGGTPAYGYCGGGLLIYNLETGKEQLLTHEDLIRSHSTVALAALADGTVVGGTTTSAGTGGHAVATEGALYVMDWQSKRIVYQTPVAKARVINELIVGPDGLVYGFAGGTVFFAFDATARKLVHQEDMAHYGHLAGGQAPRVMSLAPDGWLYVLFGGCVVRIEPGTFRHEKVVEPPVRINVGIAIRDGRIYFSSGSHLYSCRLGTLPADETAPVQDHGLKVLRSEPGRDRHFLVMRCGETAAGLLAGAHNSIALALGDKWLLTDPESRDTDRVPAGSDVGEGLFNSARVQTVGRPEHSRTRDRDSFVTRDYGYVKASTLGFGTDREPWLHVRHALRVTPDVYLVMDELANKQPTLFECLFHTDSKGTISQQDNVVRFSKGTALLDAVVVNHEQVDIALDPAGDANGPYCVLRNRRPAGEASFMTMLCPRVLQASPDGTVGLGTFPVLATSDRELRPLVRGGLQGIFYRGTEPGDFVTFEVNIAEAGKYELTGGFYQSPLYGVVQLSIDGREQGEPYDGYAKAVDYLPTVGLGSAHLTPGKHQFRYQVAGKNDTSGGYLMGIMSLRMDRADAGESTEAAVIPDSGVRVTSLAVKGAFGASLSDEHGVTTILLAKSNYLAPVQGAGLSLAGRHAVLSLSANGDLRRIVLHRGRQLKRDGDLLLSADREVSVALTFSDGSARGVIRASQASTVRLCLPPLSQLTVRSRERDVSDCYDAATGVLTLSVKPGAHSVVAQFAQP